MDLKLKALIIALAIAIVIIAWCCFKKMRPSKMEKLEDIRGNTLPKVIFDPDVSLVDQTKTSPTAGTQEISASDLLPNYSDANKFDKEKSVTDVLKEQNFIIGGHHTGINTVMQSKKIAYLDIRSLPPIPKESVGPFNQSSFEQNPGATRRHFEIGSY